MNNQELGASVEWLYGLGLSVKEIRKILAELPGLKKVSITAVREHLADEFGSQKHFPNRPRTAELSYARVFGEYAATIGAADHVSPLVPWQFRRLMLLRYLVPDGDEVLTGAGMLKTLVYDPPYPPGYLSLLSAVFQANYGLEFSSDRITGPYVHAVIEGGIATPKNYQEFLISALQHAAEQIRLNPPRWPPLKQVDNAISRTPMMPAERKALRYYYGIQGKSAKSEDEIAELIQRPASQVREYVKKAVAHLSETGGALGLLLYQHLSVL
ncbi:MAG: hypothetical protein JWO40_325 [Candidatus Doudnabacteria bacterium]|nr:hypothetical protein [Candidatus Doudnabacteria bacterium]